MAVNLVENPVFERKTFFNIALDDFFPAWIHVHKIGSVSILPARDIEYSFHGNVGLPEPPPSLRGHAATV
jgi:hypothetical protein